MTLEEAVYWPVRTLETSPNPINRIIGGVLSFIWYMPVFFMVVLIAPSFISMAIWQEVMKEFKRISAERIEFRSRIIKDIILIVIPS